MTYTFGAQSADRHVLRKRKLRAYFARCFHRYSTLNRGTYLRPPGRRFGIIKPLTLDKSPAFLKEPRCVFAPRWLKSAVDLAIIEQVSQAVESRNAFSSKTNYRSRTYSSFAKRRQVSGLKIRPAF